MQQSKVYTVMETTNTFLLTLEKCYFNFHVTLRFEIITS